MLPLPLLRIQASQLVITIRLNHEFSHRLCLTFDNHQTVSLLLVDCPSNSLEPSDLLGFPVRYRGMQGPSRRAGEYRRQVASKCGHRPWARAVGTGLGQRSCQWSQASEADPEKGRLEVVALALPRKCPRGRRAGVREEVKQKPEPGVGNGLVAAMGCRGTAVEGAGASSTVGALSGSCHKAGDRFGTVGCQPFIFRLFSRRWSNLVGKTNLVQYQLVSGSAHKQQLDCC